MRNLQNALFIFTVLAALLACNLSATQAPPPTASTGESNPTSTLAPNPDAPTGVVQATETMLPVPPTAMSTPIPTLVPTVPKNVIPNPAIITVSLKPVNPPTGLLSRFQYFMGSALGDDPCFQYPRPSSPGWINNLGYNGGADVPISIGNISFCAYGLNQANGSIHDPTGNPVKVSLSNSQWFLGCTQIDFQVVPGMLFGKYSISMQDKSTKLTDTFNLTQPTQPGGFWTGTASWFSGFTPNETIQIIVYQENKTIYRFVTEKAGQTDRNGMARVEYTDVPSGSPALYVEITGTKNECASTHSGDAQEVPCGDAMNAAVRTPLP